MAGRAEFNNVARWEPESACFIESVQNPSSSASHTAAAAAADGAVFCQLCSFINSGELSQVQRILETKGDNCVDPDGQALYCMIRQYQNNLYSMPEMRNVSRSDLWKSSTIRHSNMRLQYLNLFRLLLRSGVNPNVTIGRETTLMAAVRTHDQGFIALLLQHGADPNWFNSPGELNAFALAIIINDVSIVEQFLHYGAKVNKPCCGSMTPIQVAVNKRSEISDLLLQSGADTQQVIQFSSPHDISFTDFPLIQAVKAGNTYLASVLLEHGENVNQTDSEISDTALHLAVKQASYDMVDALIQHGANMNLVNHRGHTPLGLSLLLEDGEGTRIAELLLKSGCSRIAESVISLFHRSYTPIFVACFRGQREIVDILLEVNDTERHDPGLSESVSTEIRAVQSPDDLSSSSDSDTNLRDLTLKQNISGKNFKDASSKSDKASVNSKVDCRALDGCTPLVMAVLGGHYDLAQHLLDLGADGHVISWHGNLIHAAVMSCSESSIKLLKMAVGLRCDLNLTNDQGNTPLHLAARIHRSDVCLYLVQQGTLLNKEDRFGETPLSASVYFGCSKNSELLIQHGADLDLVDTSGTTALYWAIFNNRQETLRLLLSAGARFSPEQLAKYPRNLKIWREAELMKFILAHVCEPRSLLDLCGNQIRQTLKRVTQGQSVMTSIDLLPVPSKVKDKLSLRSHDLGEDS